MRQTARIIDRQLRSASASAIAISVPVTDLLANMQRTAGGIAAPRSAIFDAADGALRATAIGGMPRTNFLKQHVYTDRPSKARDGTLKRTSAAFRARRNQARQEARAKKKTRAQQAEARRRGDEALRNSKRS
ncbi:MAG: hypothetical protein KGH72_01150 [Candidatus Micrarchaeota archaeon]|nr:hypothetical protein [Candidatus Micrarchaeota archaeon]